MDRLDNIDSIDSIDSIDGIDSIPYSLKFSRTKIFVDFVGFEAPTKILSTKFLLDFMVQRVLCLLGF